MDLGREEREVIRIRKIKIIWLIGFRIYEVKKKKVKGMVEFLK